MCSLLSLSLLNGKVTVSGAKDKFIYSVLTTNLDLSASIMYVQVISY